MPTTTVERKSPAVALFASALAGLLVIFAAALVLMPLHVKASDLNGITKGTYLLYKDGQPNCSAQAVEANGGIVLLTANHCVTDKESEYSVNRVTLDGIKKVFEAAYYVDVVRRDEPADMAVLRPIDNNLKLDTVDLATVDEAKAALTKGAGVLVAGFPNTEASPMGDLVFTEGMFTGLSKAFVPTVTAPMLRTTASVYYGNSGGGLYTKIGDTWKLVGITSETDPELRWANSLFVSRDSIEKSLRLSPKPATDH